jgi:tetratricopeptide (TPR) repeat protein
VSRAPATSATLTSAELATEYSGDSAQAATAGNFPIALTLADRALALTPKNAWAHYNRAVALHHLGRTREAVDEYREAQARFDEKEAHGRAVAIYGRARALDDAGWCDEARPTYAEFITAVASYDPNAAEMARAYARQCGPVVTPPRATSAVSTAVVAKDYAIALVQADRALASPKNEPPDPWLDYNRAVALAELGRTDEAVKAFETAERRFHERGGTDRYGESISVYGRARALDNAGRCAAAQKAYRAYVALAPSRADADQALATARKCSIP